MCGTRFFSPLFLAVMLCWSWSQVLAAHELGPGENGPENGNRLYSNQDPSNNVTLYNPHPLPTKLFASCIVIDTAFVRFRKLHFQATGVDFTRYVPNADQRQIYNISWRAVNDFSLNTSLACATYAEKNADAMMYNFNGTVCRVSTARMPMKQETCGVTNAEAVFVRTSCPEPTPQVTLAPAPGAMNISWTTNDPCHLAAKFEIKWVNVNGSNVVAVNKDVFQFRIGNRLGCETQTVTITALDSFSQPYGNPTAVSKDTLPRGPPTMATLAMVAYLDHLDVTWSIADDECLRINEFVVEWKNGSAFTGSTKPGKNTYSHSITGLHACITLTVTVKARYDRGAGTTNVLSNSTETLTEDPVIETFVVDSTTHNNIKLSWGIRNYCNFLEDLKLSAGEGTYDLTKTDRSYTIPSLACDKHLTIDLILFNRTGVEFGSRKSLNASTTNPDPLMERIFVNAFSYDRVIFQWALTDLCDKATKVKVIVNGGSPIFLDDTVQSYDASPFPCATAVSITVTPVDDATSATQMGVPGTASGSTKTEDTSFGSGLTLPSVSDNLALSWSVSNNQMCNYITGYTITYGSGQSQAVSDPTATSATINGYDACDQKAVTVTMLKGTSSMATITANRQAPKLSPGSVTLGFRKAGFTWSADDECSLIHHFQLTYQGSIVNTVGTTASATITEVEQCQNLPVTIDGVDSSDTSVTQGPLSPSISTTSTCNSAALAEDVCYGCLYYLMALPKLNKADAATKCTGKTYNLYRPADAAEVAELIAFLASKFVPAAAYADFRLYVDLTNAGGTWTWGGSAAVVETSSSNWAASHPDSSIGDCAILSGEDGFKLVSVDCASLQFAVCIKYITP